MYINRKNSYKYLVLFKMYRHEELKVVMFKSFNIISLGTCLNLTVINRLMNIRHGL